MATANEFKFSTRCHTIDSCHTPPPHPPCCCYWQTACENARVRGRLQGRLTITSATAHAPHLHLESGQRESSSHNCAWGNVCVATLQWQLHQVVERTDFDCVSCFLLFYFCQQFAVIKDICVQHVRPCTIVVSACPCVRLSVVCAVASP